jgi:preprotein translocase subunit SecE
LRVRFLPGLPFHQRAGSASRGAADIDGEIAGKKNRMLERLKTFLTDTKNELKKVTWPTKEELKESTRVVIVASFLLTVFIGVVDQILSRIIKLIFR